MKKLALSLSLVLLTLLSIGQEYPISTASITDCGAFLVDDGYSASDYSPDGNYTTTICSDGTEASDLVNLYFTIFDLGAGDEMKIYDGADNTAALIGTYTADDLQGLDITATTVGGCLTVEFTSDSDANVGNFGAEISCGLPCAKPWAAATASEDNPIQICVGEEITFDGTTTIFADGRAFQSAEWDFGDGAISTDWPTTTHSFGEGGAYPVSLTVTDDNGCQNANLIDLIVYVSTTPTFDFSNSSNGECLGTEIDVTASVTPTNWTNVAQADFPGALWVPDSQGACFEHELTYSTFIPGATITDVNQIENISINFEHTYMGDLVITFICPNGQSIVTHQQGGGSTNLGDPVTGTDGTPGEGYDYFWDPDASNGTWSSNSGGTLASGSYEPVQPFTNLVGCPLNGTWEIEVCDLWGSDDGYIFDWAINVDPSLSANVISFTPEIETNCDDFEWTGAGITDTEADCSGITVTGATVGDNDYTLEVVDNFGCSYAADATVNYISGGACNASPTADDDSASTNEDTDVNIDVLDGDEDSDGTLDIDSMTITNQPSNGDVTIEDDGTITYSPDDDFNGTDEFTYSICDDAIIAVCAEGTVTVTVNPVNDAPVAVNDDFDIEEDQISVFDILSNDSDTEGLLDEDNLSIISQPEHGEVTILDNGTVQYTPDENYAGNDSFTYEICDLGLPLPALCEEATVTIEIAAVNDPPVVLNDEAEVPEDSAGNAIVVLDNDDDVDGTIDASTLSIVNTTENGYLYINDDDVIVYSPAANFYGEDSFSYEVCDNEGSCNEASVTITVTPVNDAPSIVDDEVSTNEDIEVVIAVLDNDSDIDGNINSGVLIILEAPENGTATVNDDGTVTYLPNLDYFGSDSFTYKVCDDGTPLPGICGDAIVSIEVLPVNDAPVADDEFVEMQEDAVGYVIDILNGDEDVDSWLNASSVNIIDGPENAEIIINGDGSLTFVPDENYNGPDSFTYEVCDIESPALCDQAEVQVNVIPVNDIPNVEDNFYSVEEDSENFFNVLANDSDVDGNIVPSSLTITSGPSNGSVTVNEDGSLNYIPNPDFQGNDEITYLVCDDGFPTPAECAEATILIFVGNTNDPPVAIDDFYETDDQTAITIDPRLNDFDLDGDNIFVTALDDSQAEGSCAINPDGTITYFPVLGFCGLESISYALCDSGTPQLCDIGTILIVVGPADSDNDGLSDFFETVDADTDEDGTPDYLDLDSDNDGMLDSDESHFDDTDPCAITVIDSDEDGIPDHIDEDSDNDGIDDVDEVGDTPEEPVDTDNDGTPDYLDEDADDDGISDEDEAGNDPDGPVDTDGDGTPDYIDEDSDDDGMSDEDEAGDDPENPIDTDGDGDPDYTDVDSDDDGISDEDEAGDDPENPVDTDDDGTPDHLDEDSDDDGISDEDEAGDDPENPIDTDGDGDPDYTDVDSDDDGISDEDEAGDDPENPIDTDGDGDPDYTDVDSDDDGISDEDEAGDDPENPIDTDGDGDPDYTDVDSDDDGISDEDEVGDDPENPLDTDGDGTPDHLDEDSDDDGISDEDEAGDDPENPIDTDGDGDPDYTDVDSDDDGISDEDEAGDDPENPIDTDGDGDPDYTDVDSDDDGISDEDEAGDDPENPIDTDGDGDPDYTDVDSDDDGISDEDEAGDNPDNPIDTDGDGDPDYTDTDSDGDGIPDEDEAGDDPDNPIDTDGDGDPDYTDTDSDGDGIPDEDEAGDDPNNPIDSDGDGNPDYVDDDADNDGISDNDEDLGADCDLDGIPNELDPDPCYDAINPPQGFSPNGDNVADTWVIPGLEAYPNATVSIFNRWGAEVFVAAPYNNDWNGDANRNGGGSLPGATYYYVLDLGDGSKPTTGFIYMTRN